MEKIFNNKLLDEVISLGINKTRDYQRCSFITPDGKFLKIYEHYEIIRWIVQVKQLVTCDSDAELLLSDLGYIKYSFIGFLTLANKEPTLEQYNAMRVVLKNISKTRDEISIQIFGYSRFYANFKLDNVDYIIEKIKDYYKTGQLTL